MMLLFPVSAQVSEKLNSIVAIVNNQSISRLELVQAEAEIAANAARQNIQLTPAEISKEAFEELLLRSLQLQLAERLQVRVPEAVVDERLAALGRQWQADDEAQFARLAKERLGLDMENLRHQMNEQIRIEAVFYREVFQKTAVTEKEIEQFLNNEAGFSREREYHLYHLLIKGATDESKNAEARTLIESLRRRIVEEGESFADLAREYSVDDSAEAGGDLQWRSAEQLPSPFVATAEKLNPGETGEIIATQRGFHLLQLVAVRGGDANRENVVRSRISHLFLPLGREAQARELYQALQGGADFAELVKEHSIDERSVDKDGNLGVFLPSEMPPYFVQAVADIDEGEVTPPIVSPFGVHLVRLEERLPVDIQAAREWAGNVLRERRALEQRPAWLKQLRERAYIRIVDPAYAGFIDDLAG